MSSFNLKYRQDQDKFPKMFTYQLVDQRLINNALQDVEKFYKKISPIENRNKKIEEILKDHNHNYQQLKSSIQQFVECINEQILKVFAMDPSYFQEQIEKNKINLKLNIQKEHVTLVWTSTNNGKEIDDSSWRKHIYSRGDTANLILILPSIDFIKDINEAKDQDMNKLEIFTQEYQIIYQVAETEIYKVKQQLQQLSTQQEKDIMLIFAINNIELKFTLSEQLGEQKLRKSGHQIMDDLYNRFIPSILEKYYQTSNLSIDTNGIFTPESLQKELSLNLEQNVHDETFERIKERRSQNKLEKYDIIQICGNLVEVINNLHKGTIEVVTIEEYFNNFPTNPDSFILITQSLEKYQFTIVTYVLLKYSFLDLPNNQFK